MPLSREAKMRTIRPIAMAGKRPFSATHLLGLYGNCSPRADLLCPRESNNAIFGEWRLDDFRSPISIKSGQLPDELERIVPTRRFFVEEPSFAAVFAIHNDLTANQVRREFIALEELDSLDGIESDGCGTWLHPPSLS